MKRLIIIAFVLAACNGQPPQPPPPPPPLCDAWAVPDGCECPADAPFADMLGVCAPPRVDRKVDWGAIRGMTAFSLALRPTQPMARFVYYAHEHGFTTFRVGAQTSHDWCPSQAGVNAEKAGDDLLLSLAGAGYLPCGPAHGSRQANDNLIRLLEVTARIDNTWVQLIPTFTYKSHDEGTQAGNVRYFNRMFDHVNSIVKAGNYKHVVYELFNEVEHPLSNHIKDEDVREMFLHAKRNTTLPISTDFHGEFNQEDPWPGRYPYIWRDVATYIAFHTRRNPEPTYQHMKQAKERWNYGKPVLVDETVCYASDEEVLTYKLKGRATIAKMGYGTEESRMAQVVTHLRDIHRNGWRPFYHSIWGIHCQSIGDMPNYDEDIAR